jgi:methylenetetrahydrofolate--tRNA-(uracil-5-)-methyltransferase
VESTGSGLVAGLNAARLIQGRPLLELPRDTVLGALAHYICNADPDHFQPMNANFGILPPVDDDQLAPTEGKRKRLSKLEKKEARAQLCLAALEAFKAQHGLG